MFTALLHGPRRRRTWPDRADEERLRRLLHSRPLRPHRFSARCEIGPFVVAHVCRERSLVVELLAEEDGQRERQEQRAGFLAQLGYTVLRICPRELRRDPRRVLRRVQAALRTTGR